MAELTIAFQMELLLRLVLASLCGFIIGYERKHHYKPAGVKTYMIVSLSSALIMIVSKYAFRDVMDYDAARIAAQVVSGVSFLGTGIIIKKNQSIEGLTTAALIWGMAGIGLALGAGMYFIGLASTLLYMIMSLLIRRMENRQKLYHASYLLTMKTKDPMVSLLHSDDQKRIISYKIEKRSEHLYSLKLMINFHDVKTKDTWEFSMLDDQRFLSFEQLS